MAATTQTAFSAATGRAAVAGRRAGRRAVVVRAAHQSPFAEELKQTAKYIAQRGRGILASDESNATTGALEGRCAAGWLCLWRRRRRPARAHALWQLPGCM